MKTKGARDNVEMTNLLEMVKCDNHRLVRNNILVLIDFSIGRDQTLANNKDYNKNVLKPFLHQAKWQQSFAQYYIHAWCSEQRLPAENHPRQVYGSLPKPKLFGPNAHKQTVQYFVKLSGGSIQKKSPAYLLLWCQFNRSSFRLRGLDRGNFSNGRRRFTSLLALHDAFGLLTPATFIIYVCCIAAFYARRSSNFACSSSRFRLETTCLYFSHPSLA